MSLLRLSEIILSRTFVFSDTLQWYDQLLGQVVEAELPGWATPAVNHLVALLHSHLGLNLTLYPEWKHVFVLMTIYFYKQADAVRTIERLLNGAKNRSFGFYYYYGLGAVTALTTSVAAGTIKLNHNQFELSFLFVSISILGVAFYDLLTSAYSATFFRQPIARQLQRQPPSWLLSFGGNVLYSLRRALIGIGLSILALQIPAIQQQSSPALLVSGGLSLALALEWYLIGARRPDQALASVAEEPQQQVADPKMHYQFNDVPNVGLAMLAVFASAGGSILLDFIVQHLPK
jgi:hypothetical protein